MNLIQTFDQSIKNHLKQCDKKDHKVCTVVASKYLTVEQMLKLYQMGQRHFGENKVQDALAKIEELPSDVVWHFMGHLQKNKVNKIIDRFAYIHSIDSLELAQKISSRSSKPQKIFIQVNLSGEETKEGFSAEDFSKQCPMIEKLPNIEVVGLMTMGPHTSDQTRIRTCFQKLAKLKQTGWELSMGMSSDYLIAIEEGASFIRVGRYFLNGLTAAHPYD